jgi:hypothetical protein
MARKTKQQQIDALTQRLQDIYSGASGRFFANEEEWPTAEELSRIIPAAQATFDPEEEKPYLWAAHNLDEWECIAGAAEWLHSNGIRA